MNQKNLLWAYAALIFFVYALILVRSQFISFKDGEGRHHIRGDGYSDINTFSAVLYWRDFGYWEGAFRPYHHYEGPGTKDQAIAYTHYPAGPDLFSSFGYELFGLQGAKQLRLWIVFFSLGLLPLIFYGLGLFVRDPWDRFYSFALLLSSGYFVYWADGFHKHLHEYFLFWIWFILLFRHHILGHKKWLMLLGPWISLWTVHSSFESVAIAVTMIVGTSFVYNKSWIARVLSKENIYFGVLFVMAFAIHLALNARNLGSWDLAIDDMMGALVDRVGANPEYANPLDWQSLLLLPFHFVNRIERYFFVPGWLLIIFIYAYAQFLRQQDPKLWKFFLVTLAASVSWVFLMPQHANVHHFVAKHLGIIVGLLSVWGIRWIYSACKNEKGFKRAAAALGLAYLLVMGLTQIVYPVWWKYSLSYLAGGD